ncbi:MAG: carboxylic ester hydrolase [Polaromonas sp.]|nr:carboxylic ester hydrolase [Polaromonas sp.]
MRTLEILLLLAVLLAFCTLHVAPMRAWPGSRHAPALALAIAAAQVLAEGPRWQMAPAYALTALWFLAGWLRNVAGAGGPGAGPRPHQKLAGVGLGLGALGLAFAVALPMIAPVFSFAPPAGPYAIGTLTYHWVDASRSEVFTADPKARRQLMAQIWYPAKAGRPAPRAAYMPQAEAIMAAFARLHGKPAFVFGHIKYVTTNAIPSAPAAFDQASYPVLLFLEGATGFRQMNTFQVEHLVSHGYIVVAIDQPGAAAAVVFPDGHQVAGLTPAQFSATVGPSYLAGGTASPRKGLRLPGGRTLDDSSIISYLAKDAGFALDQLAALNQADPSGLLTGKLNLQRIGALGVSLGGIVVGETCRIDPRVRACLVMDAPMPAEVVKAGLRQPGMWITRDEASMRLERERAGGWPEAEIEAHQATMRAAYQSLSGAGYLVRMPGMFHGNFTDIASWTPLAPLLGLSGPINERRAHDIVNAYSLAFFDRHLLERPARLLAGPAKQYPEVLFESRRP